MTADVEVTRSGDDARTSALVEGVTDQGIEFVDSYTALDIQVVDVGRIILPAAGLEAFGIRAKEAGLGVVEST